MIRFSAFLVVVAVGLLVAGVVTSKLLLVYIAIGVSGVALLALVIGAAVNWRELTGKPKTADTSAQGPAPVPPDSAPVPAESAPVPPQPVPVPPEPVPAATAPAAAPAVATSVPSGPPSGPSRAGYLPAAEPPRGMPAAAPASSAAFTTRRETPGRETPAPGVWEWRDDSIPAPSPPAPASAAAEAPAPPKPVPPPPDASPPDGRPPADRSPAQEQVSADATDKAKPAAAGPQPEPESSIDPELTLFTGITPAASAPLAAPSKQDEQAEQDQKPGEAEPAGPDPSMEVTVVPGVPRYHNARCILIRFMGDSDLDKMTLAAARDAGCTPCRACLPDEPEKSPE